MKIAVRCKQLGKAFDTFKYSFFEHGLKPDVYTYNTLINAVAAYEDDEHASDDNSKFSFSQVEGIIGKMMVSGVKCDEFTVEACLAIVGKGGKQIDLLQDFWNQHLILPREER